VKRYIIGLIGFCALQVSAQSISYSPYSVYGVGVLKERTSAYNRALSETGIGVRDELNFNALNPASYTSIQYVNQIFETGIFVERNKIATSELSQKTTAGNLNALNLWFRFSKRWSSTIGLAPFSTIDYRISASRNFGDNQDTPIEYSGTGGLTQFYVGHGFQVTKNLSLGFNAFYIFGNVDKEETVLAGISSGLSLENRTFVRKAGIDFGAQYTFSLKNEKSITIGSTFSSKLKLNTSSRVRVYDTDGQDSLYMKETSTDNYILPAQAGVGISYRTKRHMVATDLKTKRWEGARLEDNIDLQNTTRFSAAYEYRGSPKGLTYLSNIRLRSGFYIQNNYFKLNGVSFNEWGFSCGAGLPVAGNRASINISYHYNRSGTTDNRLISQRAQVFVLDFVFRDLWGIKRRFD
jgi:hypothetical protein